jgi:DNA polymerase-3 subunit epsilon
MREIVFDTETTGLDCFNGDRLIEIGCVELLNHIPTGRTFHAYINPRRAISADAVLVHGLTEAFLRDHPCFEHIAENFADFVGDSPLIAHNASFDRAFINMELGLCSRPHIHDHRFVDTLVLARRRYPYGRTAWTPCAPASASTTARAPSTAPSSTRDPRRSLSGAAGRPAGQLRAGLGDAQRRRHEPPPLLTSRQSPLPPRLTAQDEPAHAGFVAGAWPGTAWARYRADMQTASAQAA